MPALGGKTEYRDSVVAFLNLNYLVLNGDYDKIVNMEDIAEQSYDTKGSKNKSKEDIDAFNKAVNEFNSANDKYNATNNSLNKKRTEVFNDWEKTASNFIDKLHLRIDDTIMRFI
jgi:hypothetical protein